MIRMPRLLFAAVLAVVAVSASALDLTRAKSQGLVGEQRDGYLGAVAAAPSAEVRQLVSEVNAARRAEYERIARSNRLELGQVEKLAAQKAIEKTRPGHYVQAADGSWVRK
jgi:hypothetical protein